MRSPHGQDMACYGFAIGEQGGKNRMRPPRGQGVVLPWVSARMPWPLEEGGNKQAAASPWTGCGSAMGFGKNAPATGKERNKQDAASRGSALGFGKNALAIKRR